MEKPVEESYPDLLSDRQIIRRFIKLFGRDMTPKERQIFFLPDNATSDERESSHTSSGGRVSALRTRRL